MIVKRISATLIALFLITSFSLSLVIGNESIADDRWAKDSHIITNIVGVDALGREITKVKDLKQDKYVGIFYFAWHSSDQHKVFDVTKILRDNPEDLWSMDPQNRIAPKGSYYFNEPLYGYYNSSDPWVIRKHIELFIAAGIDFIAYDFTNHQIFWKPLNTMLELLNEYHEAGWKVPQVMFFTKKDCKVQIPLLYEKLYMDPKYSHLWFKGSGKKPYLIGQPEDIEPQYHNYFNVRYSFWPSDKFRLDGWPYVDFVRPQRLFTNLMSVSVSQHKGGAFSWSIKGPNNIQRPSWGRGYTTDNPTNGNPKAIESGANFQEQWDYAIKQSPEMIFITGWNEWIAGKFINEEPSYGGVPYWVNTFNTEFSRDAEMTKSRGYVTDKNGKYIEEGYGDNFYMQMVDNIRKYKGVSQNTNIIVPPVSKTINVNGLPNQWNVISNVYLSTATKKIERNFQGFTARTKYTQALPKNIIKQIRVTHDKDNLYFYIETQDNISAYENGKTNWMNLFIGISNQLGPNWENYHYVINRNPSKNTTSLEQFTDGYKAKKISDVNYSVQGKVMQIKVSRDNLKLGNNFSIYFKAADSIEKESDIMDYYVSGESVPLGRLSFNYAGSFSVLKTPGKDTVTSSPNVLKTPEKDSATSSPDIVSTQENATNSPNVTNTPNENSITSSPDLNTKIEKDNTSIVNWTILTVSAVVAVGCIAAIGLGLGKKKKK